MSCDRCKDIHTAQTNGLTQNTCNCTCHGNTTWVQPYAPTWYSGTSGNIDVTADCSATTLTSGFTPQFTQCTCSCGCSHC